MHLNGRASRPNQEIKPGDVLEITRPQGRRQRVVIRALAAQHIAKAEARKLYEDTTPPPSPEEQQMLDLIRLAGRRDRPGQATGSPDRRERRRLREAKEDGGW